MSGFGQLESRLARVAGERLANSVALVGGLAISGIYDAEPAEVLEFASGHTPVFQYASSEHPPVNDGAEITILSDAGALLMRGTVDRSDMDGCWTTLHLQETD